MKNIYKKPMVFIEHFSPNICSSACTGESKTIAATFDCLLGNRKDTSTVIAAAGNSYGLSACTNAVGILPNVQTVYAPASNHSTDGSSFTWNGQTGTATGASGLVYICADFNFSSYANTLSTDHWYTTDNGTVLTHAANGSGNSWNNHMNNQEHAMVAAYYGDVQDMAIS